MKIIKEQLKEHERRISLTEQKVDKLFDRFNEILTQMTEITTNMKYIQGDLNKMLTNFKEALTRNSGVQESEHKSINEKINKLEKGLEELERKIDARTIEKNSSSFDKLIWLVIGGAVGFLFFLLEKVVK